MSRVRCSYCGEELAKEWPYCRGCKEFGHVEEIPEDELDEYDTPPTIPEPEEL